MMLILKKENAVEEWRALMGPADPEHAKATSPSSMRARFASDILHNSLHGASSEEQALEKIHFIFGDIRTAVELHGDGDSDSTNTGTLMLHMSCICHTLCFHVFVCWGRHAELWTPSLTYNWALSCLFLYFSLLYFK